jgi:gas vesicle protein
MGNNQGGCDDKLVYFLTGVSVGALIALFFAPKAGSEFRSELADRTRKGLDYARDTGRELGERASDLTAYGKQVVSDLTDQSKELINRQKAQFAAAIAAGKQGYREAKRSDQGKAGAVVEEMV